MPDREPRLTGRAGSIPVASQDLNLHHAIMPQAPKASTPTEVLAGLVERVTFHNDENGFCVLRVKARGQRDLGSNKAEAAKYQANVNTVGTGVQLVTNGAKITEYRPSDNDKAVADREYEESHHH